jgi:hypothetical protein
MSKIPELMSGRSLEHSATINGPVYTKRGVVNHPAAKMSGQIFAVQGKLVQNSNVATSFGSVSLPVGTLSAGTLIRVTAVGSITNQNAADTFGVTLKLGSLTVATIAARDPATNDLFHLQCEILVCSTGASGLIRSVSHSLFGASGAYIAGAEVVGTVTNTLDTTAVQVLDLLGTWGAISANNIAKLDGLSVEIVG